MSVVLRNAQRAVRVRRAPLRRAVCALRAALDAARFDVGLVCAGNGLMRRLNSAYRQRPEPTDVLSFPFHRLVAGELPRPRCRDEYNLGDIFLGVEYIHQQCCDTGEDFDSVLVEKHEPVGVCPEEATKMIRVLEHLCCEDRLRELGLVSLGKTRLWRALTMAFPDFKVTAAHGLCHLLGYQHNTKSEWQQMYQKEVEILEELNRLTGASLRPLTAGLF